MYKYMILCTCYIYFVFQPLSSIVSSVCVMSTLGERVQSCLKLEANQLSKLPVNNQLQGTRPMI